MKILIVGANGLLDSAAVAAQGTARGHRSLPLERRQRDPGRGFRLPEFFPRFSQVPADEVGLAYVKSVEGIQTGQVFALD